MKSFIPIVALILSSFICHGQFKYPNQSFRATTNVRLLVDSRMPTGLGFYLIRPLKEQKARKIGLVFLNEGSSSTREINRYNDTTFTRMVQKTNIELSLRYGNEAYLPITTNFRFLAGTEYLIGMSIDKTNDETVFNVRGNDSTFRNMNSVNNQNLFGPTVGFVPAFGALLDWGKLTIGAQFELPIQAAYLFGNGFSIFDFNVRPVTTKFSLGYKLK